MWGQAGSRHVPLCNDPTHTRAHTHTHAHTQSHTVTHTHTLQVMRENRMLRESQYAERRDRDWEETLRRELELHHSMRAQYEAQVCAHSYMALNFILNAACI